MKLFIASIFLLQSLFTWSDAAKTFSTFVDSLLDATSSTKLVPVHGLFLSQIAAEIVFHLNPLRLVKAFSMNGFAATGLSRCSVK